MKYTVLQLTPMCMQPPVPLFTLSAWLHAHGSFFCLCFDLHSFPLWAIGYRLVYHRSIDMCLLQAVQFVSGEIEVHSVFYSRCLRPVCVLVCELRPRAIKSKITGQHTFGFTNVFPPRHRALCLTMHMGLMFATKRYKFL